MISENKPPQGLIIVMGVAGCGKSTVAIDVAHHHNLEFVEADDYHSDEARAKMAKGIPLTDADREPWIQAICALVKTIADQGSSAILACSALRKAHRDRFRAIGIPTVFLFLDGSEGLLQSRLENREGHFFPAAM
jgi:gluconokinase